MKPPQLCSRSETLGPAEVAERQKQQSSLASSSVPIWTHQTRLILVALACAAAAVPASGWATPSYLRVSRDDANYAGMAREAISPAQKLINRYVFNGAVFSGLAALALGRYAWVSLLPTYRLICSFT